MTEQQFDLFGDAPIDTPPLELPEGQLGACDVKWTTYRGKTRKQCDFCTRLIHQLGAGKAPFPRTATSRRYGPNDDVFLCPEHAVIQREKDNAAEAVRKARLAENEQQTAAERAAWARRRAARTTREGLS
jgi:hypothetical protein